MFPAVNAPYRNYDVRESQDTASQIPLSAAVLMPDGPAVENWVGCRLPPEGHAFSAPVAKNRSRNRTEALVAEQASLDVHWLDQAAAHGVINLPKSCPRAPSR
jgi:hypothetical protein